MTNKVFFCAIVIILFMQSLFLFASQENSTDLNVKKPAYKYMGLYCTVRDTEKETIDFIDKCKSYNIDCLIPSLSGGGTVIWATDKADYYPSLKEKFDSGYDALTVFIKYAHKAGIKVYPSVAICPEQKMLQEHPEWETLDRKGRSSSATTAKAISLAYPEARKAKINVIMDLANNYNVDGILLDYCRFPENSTTEEQRYGFYGYDKPLIDACISIYGFDPREEDINSQKWNIFNQMRQDCITTFVSEFRAALKKSEKNIRLGGFGDTDPELEAKSCGRNYAQWGQKGLIDDLFIGIYPDKISQMRDIVKNVRSAIGPNVCLYSSLSPFNNFIKTNEEMVKAAEQQLLGGSDRVWIYRDDFLIKLNLWDGARSAGELSSKK